MDHSKKDQEQVSNDISHKKEEKGFSSIIKGLKELSTIEEPKSQSSKSSEKAQKKEKDKDPADIGDYPKISFTDKFSEHDTVNYLKSHKKRIIKYSALFLSLIFIGAGILLISTSAVKVSDNVIFGERAMLSVFLILIGIMGISTIYARKLLSKSFFQKINLDLEMGDEEKEVVTDDKKYKKEDNNNINSEN